MLPENIYYGEVSRRIPNLDVKPFIDTEVEPAAERKARLRQATEHYKAEIREAIAFDSPNSAKLTQKQLEAFLSQFGDDAAKIRRKALKELEEAARGEWEHYCSLVWNSVKELAIV